MTWKIHMDGSYVQIFNVSHIPQEYINSIFTIVLIKVY